MDDLSDPSAIKIASIWVVWSFLALGILGWGLWVVLLVVGTQEAVSAWVQAIGSIGAILAAVLISQRGIRQLRQDRLADGFEYMQKAHFVAVNASVVVEAAAQYILQGMPAPVMLRYHQSLLDFSLEDLRGIDYAKLDSYGVATKFLNLKRSVNLTRVTIEARLEDRGIFDQGQVEQWGPNADREVKALQDEISRHLVRNPSLLDGVEPSLYRP